MDLKNKTGMPGGRHAYDQALRASHREAVATMLVAILTLFYFWAAVLLLEGSEATVFSMPLWFMASCVGGYLFSVVGVWLLVKRCFSDIPLDEVAQEYRRSEEECR